MLAACDSLARFPERFAIYAHAPRWRMRPIGNYLVFYRVAVTPFLSATFAMLREGHFPAN
jgi:hypothetical protein